MNKDFFHMAYDTTDVSTSEVLSNETGLTDQQLAIAWSQYEYEMIERERNESEFNTWYSRLRNADAETLEGYILFGSGIKINTCPEPENIELPF